MSNAKHSPDLLFEVSWEVCNKVGGIHTVISTKAQTVTRKFADRYVLLGPDLSHEGVNPEFEEDPNQLKAWRQSLYNEGIRVRVGRWKIKGEPTVVLVDFSSLIPRKDEILKSLWESYHVDSISGQWDYIEPVLFGWAAGVVIASYVETFGTPTEKAVAHFHEWMTAAGGLYLRKHAPYIATVFTTHATVMGRCIAGNRLPLYNDLPKFNADELARQLVGVEFREVVVERQAVAGDAAAHDRGVGGEHRGDVGGVFAQVQPARGGHPLVEMRDSLLGRRAEGLDVGGDHDACGPSEQHRLDVVPLARDRVHVVRFPEAFEYFVLAGDQRREIDQHHRRLALDFPAADADADAFVVEALAPGLQLVGVLLELRVDALVREVGTQQDVAVCEFAGDGLRFGRNDGVDAADLVAYFPTYFEQQIGGVFGIAHPKFRSILV